MVIKWTNTTINYFYYKIDKAKIYDAETRRQIYVWELKMNALSTYPAY